MFPRFKTKFPKLLEFDSFSLKVSKSQNWINSTLAFSKLVEDKSLVIPPQLLFESLRKSWAILLLYGPFSVGKKLRSKVFWILDWPSIMSCWGKISSIKILLVSFLESSLSSTSLGLCLV